MKGKKPKWKPDQAVAIGKQIAELLNNYWDRLADRLPAHTREDLQTYIDAVEGKRAERAAAQKAKEAATVDQNRAAIQGAAWVSAVRQLIKRASDSKLQKAFGVGNKIDPRKISSVADAITTILEGAEKNPQAALAAGFLTRDAEEGARLREQLLGADFVQERGKSTAKLQTLERDRARLRLEDTIDRVLGAAALEFVSEPEISSRFLSVIPTKAVVSAPASPPPA
jgi:hypothetical protein